MTPSPLPPEVDAAARDLARITNDEGWNADAAFFAPKLHSLWLSAQVAQAEEDARLTCKWCACEDYAFRGVPPPDNVEMWYHDGGFACAADPIHDRLASLRAQLQALNP